jgi:hypothetical protein
MNRSKTVAILASLLAGILRISVASAQVDSGAPATLPDTTIAPAEEPAPAPSPNVAKPAKPRLERKAQPAKTATAGPPPHKPISYAGVVEPGNADMRIKQDAWAYAEPATTSNRIAKLSSGSMVKVTGTTRYFAQVKLSSGVAFVLLSDIDLNRPTDKIFQLTHDSPVLSQPNHYGEQLAEVHRGHEVPVVGTSLNYVRIRMKSGLEGYVAMSALE